MSDVIKLEGLYKWGEGQYRLDDVVQITRLFLYGKFGNVVNDIKDIDERSRSKY
jgi:hypothetical protein